MQDWNKKQREDDGPLKPPAIFLADHLPKLPGGRALDIACGDGRNAIFLAQKGYDVDAVDSSGAAIERGERMAAKARAAVNFIHADLEEFKIAPQSYDLIVNFYYLQRTIIPGIKNGLKKNGVILFETYTVEQRVIGPPNNPDYLLCPNELLKLFDGLHVVFYREGVFDEGGRKKGVASIIARREF